MRIQLAVSTLLLSFAPVALAQDLPDVRAVTVEAPITAVTLYQGSAMITHTAEVPDELGTYELRVEGLSAQINEESLSARVTGAKLLDVRYESTRVTASAASSPELAKAIADLEAARREGEALALHSVRLADQNNLLNAIAAKTATESAKDFGSKSLDPEALTQQVAFLNSARKSLIEERTVLDGSIRAKQDAIAALTERVKRLGGETRVTRAAIVAVGRSKPGAASVDVRYIVGAAGWTPDYAVRAVDTGDDAADALTIEFNAVITQSTGVDWTDVALTLSTAEPSSRPAPPEIEAEYLSVREIAPATAGEIDRVGFAKLMDADVPDGKPGQPGGGGGGYGSGLTGGILGDPGAPAEGVSLGIQLDAAYADAEGEGGAVVQYALPRKVTIPSDSSRTRSQRVATIDLKPEFSHVARPIADPVVYLRAKTRNTWSSRLVAGRARLFVGDDSVGEAEMPSIIPGAEVSFWLGGDPRLEAKRVLVSRSTREEGVFGKTAVSSDQWRIDLVSSAPGATTVELSDRVPVSRDEKIKVELRDLSQPLSTDAEYLATERTRGILRWIVAMPARGGDGKPATKSVSWAVRESHSTEIEVERSAE
jgi:hypothetical protein